MKKLLSILLCISLFVVPATITANAQNSSGELSAISNEQYSVDVSVGHYAYSTYSVTVPVYIITNQQCQIIADMSNFDPNYSLGCYVTNADDTGRISLYADDYSTSGNAVSAAVYTSNNTIDAATKLLYRFRSTLNSANNDDICYFDIGYIQPLNRDRVVVGNYSGTLSLKFVCEAG